MARTPRIIIPHVPHHVTQRGNRRQQTFFEDGDYLYYYSLLCKWCFNYNVKIDAYCLMPNHVHLVLTPSDLTGMTRALAEAHRRYTLSINLRFDWRGYLWQGRFFSVPLSELHYENAIRYVELNPVRAKIVVDPRKYPWSSAARRQKQIQFWQKGYDGDMIRKMTRSGRMGTHTLSNS